MKKNMGTVDRTIRVLAAIIISILLLTGTLGGTLGIVLGVVAVAFFATSALGFCPLYAPLHVTTMKKQ